VVAPVMYSIERSYSSHSGLCGTTIQILCASSRPLHITPQSLPCSLPAATIQKPIIKMRLQCRNWEATGGPEVEVLSNEERRREVAEWCA